MGGNTQNTVALLAVLVILIIVCVVQVMTANYAKKLRALSPRYIAFEALNKKYRFYSVEPLYKVHYPCRSKQGFDSVYRGKAADYIRDCIIADCDNMLDAEAKVRKNAEAYEQYQAEMAALPPVMTKAELKEAKIPAGLGQSAEKRILRNMEKEPVTEITSQCSVSYVSPAGKKAYHFLYEFSAEETEQIFQNAEDKIRRDRESAERKERMAAYKQQEAEAKQEIARRKAEAAARKLEAMEARANALKAAGYGEEMVGARFQNIDLVSAEGTITPPIMEPDEAVKAYLSKYSDRSFYTHLFSQGADDMPDGDVLKADNLSPLGVTVFNQEQKKARLHWEAVSLQSQAKSSQKKVEAYYKACSALDEMVERLDNTVFLTPI